MSELPLKPGDGVMLNSGGPAMTVEQVEDRRDDPEFPAECNRALCTWFDGNQVRQNWFRTEMLYKIET